MPTKTSISGIVFFLLVIVGIQFAKYANEHPNEPLYKEFADCSSANWPTFSPAYGNYEIRFPCTPAEHLESIEKDGMNITSYEYASKLSGVEFGSVYVDISDLTEALPKNIPPSVASTLLWRIRKEITKEAGGKIIQKEIISPQGLTGRAYTLATEDGKYTFIRMTLFKSGIYLWSVTSTTTNVSKQGRNYLNSFTLTDLKKESKPAETTAPLVKAKPPVEPATKSTYQKRKRKTLAEKLLERDKLLAKEAPGAEKKRLDVEARLREQGQDVLKKIK
ncbi:MAG: hypothetical protein HOM11_05640 [Methylococcales bacterium]|jgi:hypothetical protein|nr:hypothetical protein [Methylococcales bacterium]MBT7444225.1 hypothetical protein [Methylococcales bacterium]